MVRAVMAVAAMAVAALAKDEDYLSAKLAPPWVDTTESPVIDLKPPPQPPNPPPPPKDGAVWGTFYPAAPPPPPPPPPPLPFPLAAAAGGGKSSGTESTGSTNPSSFMQMLAADLEAGQAGAAPSELASAHAILLSMAAAAAPSGPLSLMGGPIAGGPRPRDAPGAPLLGAEVSTAAAEEARAAAARAVRAGMAERGPAGKMTLASLLQASAVAGARRRAAEAREADSRAVAALTAMGARAAAHATVAQAMALPRFASASLSAYASRRRAAAALLRSAARAAELSAAGALKGADLPMPASGLGAGIAADSPAARAAGHAATVAVSALAAAAQRRRFRERAMATAGSTKSAAAMFGPHFAMSAGANPYSFPYNPYTFVSPHNFGPVGLGTHPFGGPLYANFGYFPPSSSILKGVVTPQGDSDPAKLGKAATGSKESKADVTDNGDAKPDKAPPTGAYNPSAPPFFLQGTGWPYPYFMNPQMAPPAIHNPLSPAHYGPRYSDIPVARFW